METPLRLYGLNGCPHCVEALNYLAQAKVPTHVVEASGDPIINDGVKLRIQESEARFPILVSFITQEVLVGFKEEDYKRVVDTYHTYHRPVSADAFAVKGNNPGEAPKVSVGPTSVGGGAASLPDVPRSLDGSGGYIYTTEGSKPIRPNGDGTASL